MENKEKYMQAALKLAAQGQGRVEPNPMVGAVIVDGGKIIGQGFHSAFGQPHAEIEAIRDVQKNGAGTVGAEMYVTLEPCSHSGKTPPCTDAIIKAGLKKLYIAAEDPLWKAHSIANGQKYRGLEVLKKAGIETEIGICRDAAVMLNAAFYKKASENLPLVIAKWAMTADGKIATKTGSSKWISGPHSRQIVHDIRGKVDAIIIGAGTAIKDNPLLTCRESTKNRIAQRVVLCSARVPETDSHLVCTAEDIPTILAYPCKAPPKGLDELQKRGCVLLPLEPMTSAEPSRIHPKSLLNELYDRGASNLLIEGGSSVLGTFMDDRQIDRVIAFIAPKIAGGESGLTAVGGTGIQSMEHALKLKGKTIDKEESYLPERPNITVKTAGNDIILEGWLKDPRKWYQSTL